MPSHIYLCPSGPLVRPNSQDEDFSPDLLSRPLPGTTCPPSPHPHPAALPPPAAKRTAVPPPQGGTVIPLSQFCYGTCEGGGQRAGRGSSRKGIAQSPPPSIAQRRFPHVSSGLTSRSSVKPVVHRRLPLAGNKRPPIRNNLRLHHADTLGSSC